MLTESSTSVTGFASAGRQRKRKTEPTNPRTPARGGGFSRLRIDPGAFWGRAEGLLGGRLSSGRGV